MATLFEGHIEKCYFCAGVWGSCTCKFSACDDPEAPGFDYGDFWIVQPNTTECGRFFVDPTVYYGQMYRDWAAQRMVQVCGDLG